MRLKFEFLQFKKILYPATCKCFVIFNAVVCTHPKTAYSCKKSARPSKAELTATKSNDIIMRPCARCASCKINIS